MNIILSIEIKMNYWEYHVIEMSPIHGTTCTVKTNNIQNKNQIKILRNFLEKRDFKGFTEWWKEHLGLIHKQITVSFGPGLRKWLKEYNKKESQEGGK